MIAKRLAAAAVVVLALAGCSSVSPGRPVAPPVISLTAPLFTPPTPDPTPSTTEPVPAATRPVGTTVTVQMRDGSGEATYTLNGIQAGATAQYSTPQLGQYVVLDVTIEGLLGTLNYNPFDFKIQMTDDRVYEPSFGDFEPTLNSGTIKPGQKVRGNVVFDVPKLPVAQVQLDGGVGGLIAVWKP